jgi:hypothetical protein
VEGPFIAGKQASVEQGCAHGQVLLGQLYGLVDASHGVPHGELSIPKRIDQLLGELGWQTLLLLSLIED